MRRVVFLAGLLITVPLADAQFEPEGSHRVLYFPQLADGGREDRWQTTLTFIHAANSPNPAEVRVEFYGNDGGPARDELSGEIVQCLDEGRELERDLILHEPVCDERAYFGVLLWECARSGFSSEAGSDRWRHSRQ